MPYLVLKTLLMPPGSLILWLTVALLVTLWRRRLGLWLLALGITALYLLTTPFVASRLLAGLETLPPLTETDLARRSAQAIVVLAGDSARDAPEFGGTSIGRMGLERIHYASYLAQRTGLPVLTTGTGAPDTVSDAEGMARVLERDYHLPPVLRDNAATDTNENARRSAEMLRPLGVDRVYVVTHAFHMPRAILAFAVAGMPAIPAPTAFTGIADGSLASWLPTATGLLNSALALHEWVGLAWYRLRYGIDAALAKPAVQ